MNTTSNTPPILHDEASTEVSNETSNVNDREAISEPGAMSHVCCHAEVRKQREAALANGYSLIRVRSREKAPLSSGWQNGEANEVLLDVKEDSTNTGLVLRDEFCGFDLDIDNWEVAGKVVQAVHRWAPRGAIVRRRAGSPRSFILFRSQGKTRKRVVSGDLGKVEVLGTGQQVVIFGVHPSGAALEWFRGLSPATTPAETLAVLSEQQIEAILTECEAILGADRVTPQGNLAPRPDPNGVARHALENELAAGIDRWHWFDDLVPSRKREVVEACLDAIDNRQHDPRDRWLSVVFAVADAETRGCPDARELALEWSKRGARWTSESDFDTAWNSFKPGGTTVGTLIHMAQQAGANLTPWKTGLAPQSHCPAATFACNAPRRGAIAVGTLPAVPPKRQWLHGIDAVRGAVSLLVAPGARGKSSWLLTLALACASGQPLLGSPIFGGQLGVLYINAEDSTDEIGLRTRAAMIHHSLTDADVPGLHVAGVDCLRLTLLKAERGQPLLHQPDWDFLTGELDRLKPDLLLIDPLVSLMGGVSLNDNSAAALAFGNFVRIAAERNLAIIIAHHAAKNRDNSSADAAMGAASLVNLARICLAIEPLSEGDAVKIGVAPWDARSIFRIIGTKQNMSPPDSNDRWFRLVSIDMPNAQPPIYPNGDRVGVVERFIPNPSAPVFPQPVISAALAAIANANPPLSPSGRKAGTSAVQVIAAAIAPHRGGKVSEV